MNSDYVIHLGRQALETALLLSAPVLVTALVLGVVVSVLQAVTAIRDSTIGLVLKLLAVAVVLLICGGWMMQVSVSFTADMLRRMAFVTR